MAKMKINAVGKKFGLRETERNNKNPNKKL